MSPAEHPLFRRFQIDGQAQLSVGTVPTTYHVYDRHGRFPAARPIAPARDRLAFGANRYRGLDLQARFFQFMDAFKFVNLFPR